MLSLVYISSARKLFSDEELKALLEQSREKNSRLEVTGMLLYKDGNFMQALEGPDRAVEELFRTIEQDSRHHGVLELMRNAVGTREFPSWSMGFRNLQDVRLREMPGYSPFMNEPLHSAGFEADPSRAQKLLRMFREHMQDR
ncbi:MAG TPA: BLUF domain-containing protein [Bryobacteraceae bacterium]|nr:BLUF domain-containing protein [Bryobacteraceae bacterium]